MTKLLGGVAFVGYCLSLAVHIAALLGHDVEARGFPGHWMVFYFVPFAYFWFADRDVQAATAEPPTTTR